MNIFQVTHTTVSAASLWADVPVDQGRFDLQWDLAEAESILASQPSYNRPILSWPVRMIYIPIVVPALTSYCPTY